MQSNPISPCFLSRQTLKDSNPGLLFICEKELTFPYITYTIQDNRVFLTMRCNTLHPHVETISYNDYKNRYSNCSIIRAQRTGNCNVHATPYSAGYCFQHRTHLCIACKKDHIRKYLNEVIWPGNIFNPDLTCGNLNISNNSNCKEHPNDSLIFYCEQCNRSICAECTNNKHKNHPMLDVKQLITSLKINKLKADFKTYEDNYFNGIDSAYIQAQLKWKNDYDEHKSVTPEELERDYDTHKRVNKELFDIGNTVLNMWEEFKASCDFNLFSNACNVANNCNTRNVFHYRPGNIHQLRNYWKSNLVVNIHNIKDEILASATGPSGLTRSNPGDYKYYKSAEIEENKESDIIQLKRPTVQQDQRCRGNTNEFEWVTTVQYEASVYSLCKLNENLYAAGVGRSDSSRIHIIEYSNNKIIHSWTGHISCIWRWHRHKKSDHLLSLSFDSDIRVWNYSNGDCLAVLKGHRDSVTDIAELTGGDIVTVSRDHSIKYWNMNTFQCYKSIKDAHTLWINCVELLAGGDWITGGRDELWKVWKVDLNNKDDISHCVYIGSGVESWLEVSDSRWCVGLSSGEIWIYNINGFTQISKLIQHTNCVRIMKLLRDGTWISGSGDSNLIVWDVNAGSCLQTIEEHTSEIYTGWIEMGENEILSGSGDYTVKTWVRK